MSDRRIITIVVASCALVLLVAVPLILLEDESSPVGTLEPKTGSERRTQATAPVSTIHPKQQSLHPATIANSPELSPSARADAPATPRGEPAPVPPGAQNGIAGTQAAGGVTTRSTGILRLQQALAFCSLCILILSILGGIISVLPGTNDRAKQAESNGKGCLVSIVAAAISTGIFVFVSGLDPLAWDLAATQNTLESVRRYIDKHPEGEFAEEARARLGELERIESAKAQEQARLESERALATQVAREMKAKSVATRVLRHYVDQQLPSPNEVRSIVIAVQHEDSMYSPYEEEVEAALHESAGRFAQSLTPDKVIDRGMRVIKSPSITPPYRELTLIFTYKLIKGDMYLGSAGSIQGIKITGTLDLFLPGKMRPLATIDRTIGPNSNFSFLTGSGAPRFVKENKAEDLMLSSLYENIRNRATSDLETRAAE